jgi:hypothetical protein
MPPTIPINHYGDSRNQQNRTARPISLFHANIFGRKACFEHSNFLKVTEAVHSDADLTTSEFTTRERGPAKYSPLGGPSEPAEIQLRAF